MKYSPILVTHPSVPSGAWTKITVQNPDSRKFLRIVNENSSVNYRIETCRANQVAGLVAGSGELLTPGGSIEENYDGSSTQHFYAYQASGGALTTLSVKEGV